MLVNMNDATPASATTGARSVAGSQANPGPWAAWMAAARPASLPMAVGPVLVGAAASWWQRGAFAPGLAMLALTTALLMQLITNLQNDVGYTARGGDRLGDRIGLPRATAEGWLQPAAVRRAIAALSLLALALGLWLVALRGWPVLALGVASLAAALAYMGGPRPIAYTPLGELTVLIFFGGVAVMGTEWLLSGAVSVAGCLGAVCVGALAAATLATNNLRDAVHDRRVGRRTLAVLAGPRLARQLLAMLLLVPLLACLLAATVLGQSALLAPLVLAPRLLRLWRAVQRASNGLALTAVVLALFRLTFVIAALLSLSLVAARGLAAG